jgi:hypothetical protein
MKLSMCPPARSIAIPALHGSKPAHLTLASSNPFPCAEHYALIFVVPSPSTSFHSLNVIAFAPLFLLHFDSVSL